MTIWDYFTKQEGGDTAFSVEAPKIKFGRGSLSEIGEDALALGLKHVGVYTDAQVKYLPAVAIVTASLERAI